MSAAIAPDPEHRLTQALDRVVDAVAAMLHTRDDITLETSPYLEHLAPEIVELRNAAIDHTIAACIEVTHAARDAGYADDEPFYVRLTLDEKDDA